MGEYTYFYDEFRIGWRSPKDGGWYYDMFDHPLKARYRRGHRALPLPDPLDPGRYEGWASGHPVRDEEQHAVVDGQHLRRHLRDAHLDARLRGRLRRLGIRLAGRPPADGPHPADANGLLGKSAGGSRRRDRCRPDRGRRGRAERLADLAAQLSQADQAAAQRAVRLSSMPARMPRSSCTPAARSGPSSPT